MTTPSEIWEAIASCIGTSETYDLFLVDEISGSVDEDGAFEGRMVIAEAAENSFDHDPDTEREVAVSLVQTRQRPFSRMAEAELRPTAS